MCPLPSTQHLPLHLTLPCPLSLTVSFFSLSHSPTLLLCSPSSTKIPCSIQKCCYLEYPACPKHLQCSPLFNLLSPFYSAPPPSSPPTLPLLPSLLSSLHRFILLSYCGSCGQTCQAMATKPLILSTSSDTSPSTHHSSWRRWECTILTAVYICS